MHFSNTRSHKRVAMKRKEIGIKERFRQLTPSATLASNEQAQKLEAGGQRILKLSFGQSPFPVPAVLVSALRSHAHQKDYLPVRGLPQLQMRIASWYKHKYGLNFEPENILIGPGSKELLFLIQLVTDTHTFLPAPSWVSYGPQRMIIDDHVSWIPTHSANDYMLDAESLKATLSTQKNTPLLIINSPSNPTGRCFKQSELDAIATGMREYGGLIVSDEIYGELTWNGAHRSVANAYPEGTIITGGLSKWCGAGGWRLGYAAVPSTLSHVASAMASVASETFSSVSAPTQFAALEAFDLGGALGPYLSASTRIMSHVCQTVAERLNDYGFRTPTPDGGFYVLPNFKKFENELFAKGIQTDVDLSRVLLEDLGIATLPGSHFGLSETEFALRLALVDFDGTRALELAKDAQNDAQLIQSLEHASPALFQFPERLAEWITNDS